MRGASEGKEWGHPMGNTLTCCLCPNANPKRGRCSGLVEPDYESEMYEVAARDTVAAGPSPATMEPMVVGFENQRRQPCAVAHQQGRDA